MRWVFFRPCAVGPFYDPELHEPLGIEKLAAAQQSQGDAVLVLNATCHQPGPGRRGARCRLGDSGPQVDSVWSGVWRRVMAPLWHHGALGHWGTLSPRFSRNPQLPDFLDCSCLAGDGLRSIVKCLQVHERVMNPRNGGFWPGNLGGRLRLRPSAAGSLTLRGST